MNWLKKFAKAAESTDLFTDRPEHLALLTAGLCGEAGSILAEVKKEKREREAYPYYRHAAIEEVGDFLWYFIRIASVMAPRLIGRIRVLRKMQSIQKKGNALKLSLDFGSAVGDTVKTLQAIQSQHNGAIERNLNHTWDKLVLLARELDVELEHAARGNISKIESRWPKHKRYAPLFDDDVPEEEQLPRHLEIEFREKGEGGRKTVYLRCNGVNFGDRLTDNIKDPDGYRFHDVFHFAYAVHMGWSPVVRALLRCKRKSNPRTDEDQDGARAGISEEAVSAVVFSRAKNLAFFDGKKQVDFSLLKTIREFVQGYEVERIPLWQWETAILEGYKVFRLLRANQGGRVILDLPAHELRYVAPIKG